MLTVSGMGNRFFTMNGYHSIVEAHGIIAAITFLGIVPAAIILARFLGRSPFWALRMHIWLQITTLILTTVVFILGNFAVGPKRALTNPHHGIGVAIYLLVIVQVFGGALVHRREKGRSRLRLPLKVMLHQWFGRMIALLGIAQVALGLTLYGSPVYLFVLYSLWTFGLVLLYFVLSWVHQRRMNEYDGDGSYLSGEQVAQDGRHKGPAWGKLAAYGAAGAGLVALFRRRSARKEARPNVAGTDESGTSYISNEKDSETGNRGWGRRLLEIGAIGGTIAAARSLFRRKDRDDSSDVGPYRPPLGGNQSVGSDSVSRIEEGRPPMRPITPPPGNSPGYVRPTHPLANPPMTPGTPGRRNSTSDYSYYSYMSGSPSRRDRRGRTFRDTLFAGGAMMGVRQLFKSRRQKKEERRIEEVRNRRLEEERLARENSQRRYTGDGITPPRRIRNDGIGSHGSSDISGSIIDDRNRRPGMGSALPVAAIGAAAAGALADRDRIRPVGDDPVIQVPGGPPGVPANIPPIPPTHRTDMESSGSEVYTTVSGRPRHRHHLRDEAAAGVAGAALGAAAADATRRRHSGRNTDSLESPPVSLRVKMHNDGRHVTLRRLTEEEAIAQREAQRMENRGAGRRRRRNSSMSSGSGGEYLGGGATSTDRRWRRNEALEAAQANAAAQTGPVLDPAAGPSTQYPPPPPHDPYLAPNQGVDPRTGQAFNLPPPPPIPGTASGLGGAAGSITSPGTETSEATEFANNRKRRRAERAQTRLAGGGRTGGGNTVDFT
jgi:Eukaryotic cytochrome b561